ncbi:MAG TPA: hypothetical protein PKE45_06950 [Caldilineaceae bacterium]|nr:hypothetical protein [Caldilineaceae bacterium]
MTIQLTNQVCARSELSDETLAAMTALFAEHFAAVNPARFAQDLAGKDWVILLREPTTGALQGFSSLALYTTVYQGQPISVVYSGDTIIRPAFWGTPELPRTWIKTVLARSAELSQPLYWLLLSSGYKTYRFLPVFYRHFYPRYDQPTPPAIQHLIDHLACERFGADYDQASGVVRFTNGATPLRHGIADLSRERMADPHIAYFLARNQGHQQGDELVCLTQIHLDNLTAAGRRMVRQPEASPAVKR